MIPPLYLPYFQEASRQTGVPLDVLGAVARQESGFNPLAIGRAGEIGMFQILPSTANRPGFGLAGVADPQTLFDPLSNILFGANYLAARAGRGVDWSNPNDRAIALARYNGGGDPNYVQRVEAIMAQGNAGESPIDRINRNRPNIGAIPGAVGDAARRAQEAIQGALGGAGNRVGEAINAALGRSAFLILGLVVFAVGLVALSRSARD